MELSEFLKSVPLTGSAFLQINDILTTAFTQYKTSVEELLTDSEAKYWECKGFYCKPLVDKKSPHPKKRYYTISFDFPGIVKFNQAAKDYIRQTDGQDIPVPDNLNLAQLIFCIMMQKKNTEK